MALLYAHGPVDQRDLVTGGAVGATSTQSPPKQLVPGSNLAYLQGGTVLAVARGAEVEFFDADTGIPLLDPVRGIGVAASPDGSILVTAAADGDLTLRDPETGRPTAPEITGAIGRPSTIELSDDSTRMLVATSNNPTWWQRGFAGGDAAEPAPGATRLHTDLRVYDVESTSQIGRTLRVGVPPNHLAGSLRPDGRQLAVATEHGVQLWDLDPDAWRDAACRLAGRNLSRDEWERYMPQGEPYQGTCSQWPADR
jgi:DNA-binding beta-propeller fold protein YncE